MKSVILSIFLVFSSFSFAQVKMIVFFKDKGDQQIEQTNFTERSLKRRAKNGVAFDYRDIEIPTDYLRILNEDGNILNSSRWLNAVSFETNSSAEELLEQYDFIERIQLIGRESYAIGVFEEEGRAIEYGSGFEQMDQINLSCLHDEGFTGEGIYLAVIDVGFKNMDTIQYFDSVYLESRVLDEYNFVNNTSVVYDYSGHGTSVASCIIAEMSGPFSFAGTGFDVDLALYVSEDLGSETEIEEFNLVVALERCDSVGVDIANISLGYYHFDDSTTSHVYADMDGETTIAALGVNAAASKGIAVVTSAGNGGPDTISTPCDADSCLCIGAVNDAGLYATFSSIGPSADGQVKPDVAARGEWAALIASDGSLTASNGTSFSSPIIAGATACLMQANPTRTVEEIFAAIRQSGSQFSSPDPYLGYGIPDICAANDLLVALGEQEQDLFSVFPNPADKTITVLMQNYSAESISIINVQGQTVVTTTDIQASEFQLDVSELSEGLYTLLIVSEDQHYTEKVMINH